MSTEHTTVIEPEILSADQAEQAAKEFTERESPQAVALRVKAEVLVIETDDAYTQANTDGGILAEGLRKAEAERKRLKAPVLEAGRRIDALFDRLMEPFRLAKKAIETAMLGYERKKEEERRRIEEEARKRAVAEQTRLDNLALANAGRAEAAGHGEKAQEILENVPTIPVPVVPTLTPTVAGSFTRKRWKGRVVNLKLLAEAVGNGSIPTEAILANETWLNKRADALRKEFNVPGCEAYEDAGKTFR